MAKNIKPRKEDYAQWYLDVIKAAQLADYSPVKGCMVIRPEGYAIWEAIQRDLDREHNSQQGRQLHIAAPHGNRYTQCIYQKRYNKIRWKQEFGEPWRQTLSRLGL